MAVGCGFCRLITLNPKPFSLMPRLGRFRRSRALEMSFGWSILKMEIELLPSGSKDPNNRVPLNGL